MAAVSSPGRAMNTGEPSEPATEVAEPPAPAATAPAPPALSTPAPAPTAPAPTGPAASVPADKPGRDRIAVHLMWEAVLVVAVLAVSVPVYLTSPALFSGTALRTLLLQITPALLLATAFAVSLRVGAANLAIGVILGATGAGFAWFAADPARSPLEAGLLALGVAVAAGLLVGLVVVTLRAPGWAVSLAAGSALVVLTPVVVGSAPRPAPSADLVPSAWWLFGTAVAISVGLGMLALEPSIRAGVGQYRPDGDPAALRPGRVMVVVSLCVSCLVAGLAGVLSVLRSGFASAPDAASGVLGPAGGSLTLAAIAAVLLGGTSVHGRRGGVAGTVLAVLLLQMLDLLLRLRGTPGWAVSLIPAAGVLAGLVVSHVVERRGRPRAVAEPAAAGAVSEESPAWAEQLLRPGPQELVRRRGEVT